MPTLAEVTRRSPGGRGADVAFESGTVALRAALRRSVVNVVDVTVLSGKAMTSGAVVPEGNGTGFVWDSDGHVVTNWHVAGGIVSQVPKGRDPGEVAKVTLEGADGRTKTFPATLVGAERSKDLAVLKVNAPKEYITPSRGVSLFSTASRWARPCSPSADPVSRIRPHVDHRRRVRPRADDPEPGGQFDQRAGSRLTRR